MRQINSKGFTLLEVLIYLFLFSFIISGALVGVYQIIDSADKTSGKIFVEQEGNFLLRKIYWALTGAAIIYSPAVNSTSTVLKLDKINLGTDNPLEFSFDASSGKLSLKRGAGTPVDLNSEYSAISALSFSYTDPDGPGGMPGGIKASFIINGQQFETIKYLR